jgi:outer membrane protein OmpA-like peptidoglycan-associated protein
MRGGPASLVNLPSSEYALRGNVQAEREGAVPEVLPAGTAGDTDGSGLSRSRKAKGSDPAEADRSVREALRKHSLEFVSTEKGTFRLELREAGVFAFDSVEVQSELRSKLVKLADVLRTQEGARVRIEGYTDGDGDPVYNTMLAKRRAEAVGLYLRKIGVAARQVQVEGRGEWAAAFPERAQDKSLQRRIEIYLVLAHPG